jgi:hypothetical protein
MPTRLVVRALASLTAASAGASFVVATVGTASRHGAARPVIARPAAALVARIAPVPALAEDPAPVPAPEVARAVAHPSPGPPAARRVVLYGDSLAWQAQGFFTAALAGAGITQVATRTYGGTAICDWFADMRADAATLHPDAVVVEFSGNAFTPCMHALDGSPLRGAAYFEKYAADAATVLDIFTPGHTLVYFAGAPISRGAERTNDPTSADLHAIYASLAQSSPYGRFTDAGAAVLLGGKWTETLPCLPGEPCTGGRDANGTPVNVVRAPDGAHFCPGAPAAVRGVTTECDVWPSGSWRFGNAMAAPVIEELAA